MHTLSSEIPPAEPTARGAAWAGPAPVALARLEGASARQLAQWFRLLADETRLQVLHFLMQRPELHVRALCDLLEQSQPAVSHHLGLLREAGLLACRREGKHNYYRLASQHLREILETVLGLAAPPGPPGDDPRRDSGPDGQPAG